MKTSLVLVALLILASPAAHAAEFLSKVEKQNVLAQLDDSASDSWDESDSEVAFVNLTCDDAASSCTIFWRMRFQGEDQFPGGDARNLQAHPWGKVRACKMENVKSLKQVSEAAYGAMDKCFYAQ